MKLNFGLHKDKSIEAPSLLIKKNIMIWNRTMIQLSNISSVSTEDVPLDECPILALSIILVGIFFGVISVMVTIICLAVGALCIYYWAQSNKKRKESAILTIRMNSGQTFSFTFDDRDFLGYVSGVIQNIIIDGGAKAPMKIDIRGCTIENSSVLNGL